MTVPDHRQEYEQVAEEYPQRQRDERQKHPPLVVGRRMSDVVMEIRLNVSDRKKIGRQQERDGHVVEFRQWTTAGATVGEHHRRGCSTVTLHPVWLRQSTMTDKEVNN